MAADNLTKVVLSWYRNVLVICPRTGECRHPPSLCTLQRGLKGLLPMFLSLFTLSSTDPVIMYSQFGLLLPTCITLHFLTLNSIHQSSAQINRMHLLSVSLSWSDSILCPSLVSLTGKLVCSGQLLYSGVVYRPLNRPLGNSLLNLGPF